MPNKVTLAGGTSQYEAAEIVTDRFGLSTGEVEWKIYGETNLPAVPGIGDPHPLAAYMTMENRRAKFTENFWLISASYAGVDPGDPPDAIFEIDYTDNEEPIEVNPNFKAPGGFAWDTNIEDADAKPDDPGFDDSAFQNGANFDADGKFLGFLQGSSPDFFGITSFIDAGCVYKVTVVYPMSRLTSTLLTNVFNCIGGKIGSPPIISGSPNIPTPSGRNWLFKAPVIQQRGSAAVVTYQFFLSGRLGWNALVYPIDVVFS